LPILLLAIWAASLFFQFEVITAQVSPLYDLFINRLTGANKYLYCFLAFLLVSFQSFYLAYVVDKHEMLNKRGYLVALIYAVVILIVPHSIIFHPILIVNTFFIWLLDKFFNLYKTQNPLAESFDAGLICALATLFYLPAVYMLLVFIIIVNILQPFSWRNIVSAMLGFLSIWLLVWLGYYLTDNADHLNLLMGSIGVTVGSDFIIDNIIYYAISFSAILMVFAISLTNMILSHYKNTSRLRRFNQVIWIYTLLTFIMTAVIFNGKAYQLSLLSLPFTLIICHWIIKLNKKAMDEVIVFLLLALGLYQFFI
jgi:hypothetical protein